MHTSARWISLTLLMLAACRDDDPVPKATGNADASAPPPDGGTVAACTEADLSKCDYPERKLTSTEREGINASEPNTGRVLPLLARVPAGAGPFPAVLWSHGGGFNDGGHRLGKEWGAALANQGYVVIHIAHASLDANSAKALCTALSVPAAECNLESGDEDSPVVALVKTLDLLAVLDKLPALSDESVARGGPALDLTKIAAGGWSGGARGPQVLLGAKLKITPSAPLFSRADPRIVAAVGLSPAGPTFGGFFDAGAETSWTAMRGPLLYATGENDVKPTKPELTGPIRRFPFAAQPADGTRRLLYSNLPVGTGGHPTYNLEDAASTDERVSRLTRALRSSVLAFMDAHVKGEQAAKDWLATGNTKVLAGDADWEQR